jgi:Flp pilus assembly protein TadD
MQARGDDPQALHELGLFYLDRGDLHQAIASFERGLALRPNHLETLVSAATASFQTADFERAERHLQRAIAVAPSNAVPRFNLGLLLEHQNRKTEAAEAFRQALALDPQHARAAEKLRALEGRVTTRPP